MIGASQRSLALLVAGCFFMENLDGTIVVTAAPRIAASLRVAPPQVGLLVTVYLLSVAVLIPLSGWMTRKYGARNVFLSAIGIFTIASAACAASSSLPELVGLRVLQGVGGAMMVPVGRLVVLAAIDKRDLLRAIAYITWPALLAPVLAPVLGGVITTYASWRWLFLINAPLGLAAVAVAWRLVRPAPGESAGPLDWPGVVLTCAGLSGLAVLAHLLSLPRIGIAEVITIGLVSLGCIAAAVRHMTDAKHPLMNLRVLRVPTLRWSLSGGSVCWIVIGATPFLLPLMFQTVFGWTPLKSGAVVLFIFLGNIGIKPATTPLLRRFGFRTVLVASTVALAGTVLAASLISSTTPVAVTAIICLASGVARSVTLTANVSVGFSDVTQTQLADANSLTATAQQLSLGFSVAAAAVLLRSGDALRGLLPGQRGPYVFAFAVLSAVAAVAALSAARLHPEAGVHVSHASQRDPEPT
jgi:EmrB/QacA subfamily drug resistance transporter